VVVEKVLELAATGDEIAKLGLGETASSQLEILGVGAVIFDINMGSTARAAELDEFQLPK
jgi:hypothetical protein